MPLLLLSVCATCLQSKATSLDNSFNPGASESTAFLPAVLTLAVQADRKILVGGAFTALGNRVRANIGRLNPDGSPDLLFNPGADGGFDPAVTAIAVQPDGKILVGGAFTTLGGQPRACIGRLHPDGTLDTSFNPGVSGADFAGVYSLVVQTDGKILVGGEFATLGGQSRANIGRLNADGTIDGTFNPETDGPVFSLVVQADEKILAGGYFTSLANQSRANIGRLNATGTLDTTFNPGVGGDEFSSVYAIALQADGKILVGGAFETLGGQARANIGRLNSDGTVDAGFNPGTGDAVQSLAVQTDGKILVGGDFTMLAEHPFQNIGRLNGDGTPDTTFLSSVGSWFFTTVSSMAVQADGKIVLGGSFGTLDGEARNNMARLHNSDPATQSLNYAGTTLTWLRGGASPEVALTTFDISSNGVTWTNLGNGTRFAGGWQLTGVTALADRAVRARGFSAGSGANNWFVESYFGKPVLTQQPVSRTNNFGTTAEFQALADGTEPFVYQWHKNGLLFSDQANINGSRSNVLALGQVSNSDEGVYTLVVSNAYGSATSAAAMLTVNDPFITQHPVSAARTVGESVTFNVAAAGTPPLGYQWYQDGAILSGAIGSSLSLSDLSTTNAGTYSVVVSNGGGTATSSPALLTVNSAGIDSTFNSGADAAVLSLAVQPDGKILVGGAFSTLGGAARSRIARLYPDGTLDTGFDPRVSSGGLVNAIVLQPDGKILIGGTFTALGDETRYRIARLNPDGTIDTNFKPVVASFIEIGTSVECMALQADGKILVGGVFTSLGGSERVNIGRLNATGTVDSFNPGLDYHDNSQPVYCLAIQADGKIVVGGEFTELGRQPRANLGRVTAAGSLDAAFNPGVNGAVRALAIQPDGKVLAGGSFTNLAGVFRRNIGRLNTNGIVDATFDPGAGAEVISIAVQADGKILVGGSFTTIAGQTRSRIARLNADGTLDGTFNPGAGSTVRAIVVQADGKILAGGNFTSLGGQSRSAIGRLNNTGAVTQLLSYAGSTVTWFRGGVGPEVWRTSFEHSADGLAWTSLGSGTRISGGWQRTGVSLPAGRTLRARGYVVGSDQNSGHFVESYFGKPVFLSQPASRTNGAGTTAQFRAVAGGSEPLNYQWLKNGLPLQNEGNVAGANDATLTLSQVMKVDEGGYRLVVSNSFGSVTSVVATLEVPNPQITQQPRDAHRNAGENVTFNVTAAGFPSPGYQWYHGAVAVTGGVTATLDLQNLSRNDAGIYTVVVSNSEGSVTSAPVVLEVNSATLDSVFDPQAGGGYLGKVHTLAVQSDGKILVGGDFTYLGNQFRDNIGRLHANGTYDGSFNSEARGGDSFTSAAVYSLAVQTDGKILVGGSFDTLSGGARNNIGRLNSDGTLDPTFNPGVTGGDEFFGTYVYCMAVQPDGKIVLGGDFTKVAGQTRNRIARLNANGTLDTGFASSANRAVYAIALQPDGKILVGGDFSNAGGSGRSRIARLNANGSLDSTFNPGVSGGEFTEVHALAVQADGKILVGGDFTVLRGQSRTNIGRLNSDGTLDTSFNPGAHAGIFVSHVYALAVQADGRILLGGDFINVGGRLRDKLARLNADGSLDSTFSPKVGSGDVLAIAVQPDGDVLVGGYFDNLAGKSRSRIARLNSTDPTSESLNLAASTVTWWRGGSGPEVWRTTLEHSTNGVSWTDLGAVTRISGGWQKSGVTLPLAGTLRARGYVTGGDESAGWFVETILDLRPTIHLSAAREGSVLIVSWTGGQGPYQVQQSHNLNEPNSWQNLGAPTLTNSITLPIETGNRFLRVRFSE